MKVIDFTKNLTDVQKEEMGFRLSIKRQEQKKKRIVNKIKQMDPTTDIEKRLDAVK